MTIFTNVACVGTHFRGSAAKELAKQNLDGIEPRLEREPDNAYDAYAIKVFVEDLFFAYIDRTQAAWIAPLMDDGRTYTVVFDGTEERQTGKGVNVHPLLRIVFDE